MTVIDILIEKFVGKNITLTKDGEKIESGVVNSIYESGDRYSGYYIIFLIDGCTNSITLDDTEITLN